MTLSTADLDRLGTDARAATPGDWKAEDGAIYVDGYREVIAPGEVACMSHCLGGSSRMTGENLEADLRHAANMDRDTALELLERLRLAEAQVQSIRDLHSQQGEYCAVCLEADGWDSRYPCETIKALEKTHGTV